jgi:hypothetical protein
MGNFYTDTIQKSPDFRSTNRCADPQMLEPFTRRKVAAILADAKAHGISLMVYETYRSEERQRLLYQQGATRLPNVGVHHYGLACDIVYQIAGEPSWKGDFGFLWHLATAHQLVWGGNWGRPNIHHSFIDSDHVQWCAMADQADLFRGTWYPSGLYNPLI